MERSREVHHQREFSEGSVREKAVKLFTDSFRYFTTHGSLPDQFPFSVDSFDQTDALLEYIGCPNDESGLITERQQKSVAIFFEELHRFVRDARRDPDQRDALEHFMYAWRETAFSVSPNIFNQLSFQDQILTSAKFIRLPETRDSIGENNLGELVYELAFFRPDQARQHFLKQMFDEASPEAKLDLIHYLALVGRTAPHQGYDSADELLDSIERFLTDIKKEKGVSPFIYYAVEQALQEVERGYTDVPENVERESRELGTWMRPDEMTKGDVYFRRVSRDAVGSFDALATLDRFASVKAEAEHPRSGRPAFQDLYRALESLENPANHHRHRWQRLVEFIDAYVMRRLPSNDHQRSYWNLQKQFPTDPEFISKLRHQLQQMIDQGEYEKVHFEYVEGFGSETEILLQEMHRPEMRAAVERDMGISLADLSLREQIQLLNYLARVDYKTAQKGFSVIREHGLNGARAFLSCEYGKEYGDAILKIAERLEPKAAAAVFAKYGELLDLTEKSTEDVFGKNPRLVDRVRLNEELMGRGKELLGTYSQLVEKAPDAMATEEILRRLQGAKTDVLVMAAVLQGYKKETRKVIDLSQLKEWFSIETIDLQDLALTARKKLQMEMRDILKANWALKGKEAMQIALEGLESGFNHQKGKTKFCVLRQGETIIAFLRFDQRLDLGPRALYAGSFNVNPDVRDPVGSTIGFPFFQEALEREASEHEIYAHVLADDRVGARYVRNNGFVITGVETDQTPEGKMVDWFRIYRASAGGSVSSHMEGSRTKKGFLFPEERSKMLSWIKSETAAGRVISDYMIERASSGERRVFVSEATVSSAFAEAA